LTVEELLAWIGACGLDPVDIVREDPLTASYVNSKNPDLPVPQSIIALVRDIIRRLLGHEPPEPDDREPEDSDNAPSGSDGP